MAPLLFIDSGDYLAGGDGIPLTGDEKSKVLLFDLVEILNDEELQDLP